MFRGILIDPKGVLIDRKTRWYPTWEQAYKAVNRLREKYYGSGGAMRVEKREENPDETGGN